MKKWQIILVKVLWSMAGAALIFLLVVSWRAKEEKKCSTIQIELVGENTAALFMDEKEILQIINTKGVKEGLPIGEVNLNVLEKNLQTIRWVKNAEIFLDNQQNLKVKIEQRIPIARIFTTSGNSFYIDKEGLRLPLKQLTVLRLPVFTNFPSDQEKLSKPDSLLLNDVLHFTNTLQTDSFFLAQTAQVNIASNGDFELIPTVGDHIVLIGSTENLEDKLNRLYTFYKKVWVQSGLNAYQVIDCRFDHQIVALKKGMQPIQFSNFDMPMKDTIVKQEIKVESISKQKTASLPSATNSKNTNKMGSPKDPKNDLQKSSVTPLKSGPKKGAKILTKTSLKTDNKLKSKTLIKQKPSAKAVMPKKPASNNN